LRCFPIMGKNMQKLRGQTKHSSPVRTCAHTENTHADCVYICVSIIGIHRYDLRYEQNFDTLPILGDGHGSVDIDLYCTYPL
jgi:hypothetical protein